MKKLLVLSLLLTGCAHGSVKVQEYTCVLAGAHGTYGAITVLATSLEEAVQTASKVRDELIKMDKIPPTVVFCEKETE